MLETLSASFERTLVTALAAYVIPVLPDVSQVPEASWDGWAPVLEALGVERSDAHQVADAVGHAQSTLAGLLHAAEQPLASQVAEPLGATQGRKEGRAAGKRRGARGGDRPLDETGAAPAGGAVCIGASQLPLTQMLGSAPDEPVLLEEPRATIIAKARMPRNGRMEVWYQLGFEGFAPGEAEWYPAAKIRRDHTHGAELIAAYEALVAAGDGSDAGGGDFRQAGAAPPSLPPQPCQHAPKAGKWAQCKSTGGPGHSRQAVEEDDEGPEDTAAPLEGGLLAAGEATDVSGPAGAGQQQQQQQQQAGADAVPSVHDLGVPQLVDEHGNILQLLGPDGLPLPPEQAAAIAAQAIAAHQAAEAVARGGKRQRESSREGLAPGDTPKRLCVPDGAAVEVDGHTLHAVPLPVPCAGEGGSLVPLQVVGQDSGPVPIQLLPAGQVVSSREALVQQAAEGLRWLMHSSEELQRKRRQQARRAELNQRRAMLLPGDAPRPLLAFAAAGAAFGAAGTGAAGTGAVGGSALLPLLPSTSGLSAGRATDGAGAASDVEGLSAMRRYEPFTPGPGALVPALGTADLVRAGTDPIHWARSLSKQERRALLLEGLRRSLPALVTPPRGTALDAHAGARPSTVSGTGPARGPLVLVTPVSAGTMGPADAEATPSGAAQLPATAHGPTTAQSDVMAGCTGAALPSSTLLLDPSGVAPGPGGCPHNPSSSRQAGLESTAGLRGLVDAATGGALAQKQQQQQHKEEEEEGEEEEGEEEEQQERQQWRAPGSLGAEDIAAGVVPATPTPLPYSEQRSGEGTAATAAAAAAAEGLGSAGIVRPTPDSLPEQAGEAVAVAASAAGLSQAVALCQTDSGALADATTALADGEAAGRPGPYLLPHPLSHAEALLGGAADLTSAPLAEYFVPAPAVAGCEALQRASHRLAQQGQQEEEERGALAVAAAAEAAYKAHAQAAPSAPALAATDAGAAGEGEGTSVVVPEATQGFGAFGGPAWGAQAPHDLFFTQPASQMG